MEGLIEFGRGPLFRLSFVLMILGLLRIVILSLVSLAEAYRRNPDKVLPWRDMTLKTAGWLVPFARLLNKRPIYSVLSFLFHVGLILVPLFFSTHVLLWERGVGFAWPALSQSVSDVLTLTVIVTGIALFFGRVIPRGSRTISRRQEFVWPLLLVVPFLTGFVCTHAEIGPVAYQWMMLIHVYSADLIMLMIPFTKIAHCVLLPLSQYVSGVAWKFPEGAGDRVAVTLGYAKRPTWAERPRVATHEADAPVEGA
jgi:nitrate reductase gamma subunit